MNAGYADVGRSTRNGSPRRTLVGEPLHRIRTASVAAVGYIIDPNYVTVRWRYLLAAHDRRRRLLGTFQTHTDANARLVFAGQPDFARVRFESRSGDAELMSGGGDWFARQKILAVGVGSPEGRVVE